MKTSQHQFDLLVTFMEEHGDLSKPTSNARGRVVTINHWEELTSLLNSDGGGDTKTTERWKKVWSDFKNNTKKKAARLHRAARGTGGGPAVFVKLTDLEQRVLNLIGIQAATGLAVAEAGFSQDIEIASSVQIVSQPETPVPSGNELWSEPGPSSQIHMEPPSSQSHIEGQASRHLHTEDLPSSQAYIEPRPPSQALNLDVDINENTRDWNPVSPALSPRESHVAAPLPRVQPAQYGQTTPRRSERPSRIRPSPRRRLRLSHEDQTAQQFVHSDAQWRAFRMEQHRDSMDMRREENRLRDMEVQNTREWQTLGLRTLNLLDKLVNKFCKD